MMLHVIDIPDDPTELPGWLERHLAGLDLAALVAELEATHGPGSAGKRSLRDLLGPRLDAVASQGLSALPPPLLRELLRRPRLLLELQDHVLTGGGAYWNRVAATDPELSALYERGRAGLASLDAPRAVLPLTTAARPRRPWLVGLALAASVLAAVAIYDRAKPPAVASTEWGWSRAGALAQDLPPAAYLDHLADAAGEWFAKRPAEAPALAGRIGEFRQGCSKVILAEHRPLSPEDRTWLVAKCRAWAAKLDAHLAAIEAGEDPISVRAKADATAHKLIESLHAKARGASHARHLVPVPLPDI